MKFAQETSGSRRQSPVAPSIFVRGFLLTFRYRKFQAPNPKFQQNITQNTFELGFGIWCLEFESFILPSISPHYPLHVARR